MAVVRLVPRVHGRMDAMQQQDDGRVIVLEPSSSSPAAATPYTAGSTPPSPCPPSCPPSPFPFARPPPRLIRRRRHHHSSPGHVPPDSDAAVDRLPGRQYTRPLPQSTRRSLQAPTQPGNIILHFRHLVVGVSGYLANGGTLALWTTVGYTQLLHQSGG